MANSASSGTNKKYTIVIRAVECQFRIPEGKGILIQPIASDYGPVCLRVLTRTDTTKKFATPIPRELWVEVTGPAPSVQEALRIAASIAAEFVRQIAFAANAWQGTLGVHLGFESTDGLREREFFQNWTADELGLPRPTRQVNTDLMFRFLVALARASADERPRYMRAITQFTDALQYWDQGTELYALSHLYMGVEAMTPTAIRLEIQRRGLKNRRELEEAVLELPKFGLLKRLAARFYQMTGGFIRPPDLESWARRELIFRGDAEALKIARKASDMLEHGFGGHDEVQRLAVQCVDKCAEYLRTFVIDSLDLDDSDRSALKNKPYHRPAQTSGLRRQVIATITANVANLPAADQAYPRIVWSFDLHGLKVLESGALEMSITQNITPSIGEGAQFRLDRIYFAGPSETTHGDVKVSVKKNEKTTISAIGTEVELDGQETARWAQLLGGFILNVNALRNLSWHWIVASGEVKHEDFPRFNFRETVDRLLASVANGPYDEVFRAECRSAWSEALAYDEARLLLAGSAVQPNGLLNVDSIEGTKASTVDDVERLSELNQASVELAKRLVSLHEKAIMQIRSGKSQSEGAAAGPVSDGPTA